MSDFLVMIVISFLSLSLLVFSCYTFSSDANGIPKQCFDMFYPCPKIAQPVLRNNAAHEKYWEFFYGPTPSRKKETAVMEGVEGLNIPWRIFKEKLIALAKNHDEKNVSEMTTLIFENIQTIKNANTNQYKSIRR